MTDRIEIVHGEKRAVFTRSDAGWVPDWFYAGDRPMVRFKDHEWLAIGHVHPTHAAEAEEVAGRVVFRGTARYGTTSVPWSLTIEADPLGDGFLIECAMAPAASIELLEAYAAFETPYDYDGSETVTTVIGMNPVSRWVGSRRVTPPIGENPAWVYSRPQSVRITAPSSAPYVCQVLTDAGDVEDRYVTVVGDWNVCMVQDLYAAPTRDTPQSPPSIFYQGGDLKGYKYLVGALNWSSAYAKDPNVLFAGGQTHRQRVALTYGEQIPADGMDALLLHAWERTALFEIPPAGRVEAYDRATGRGVTWQAAVRWLRDVYCSDQTTEGIYKPGAGICTYARGTRPKGDGGYSWYWWPQWAGPLHYRAVLTADAALQAVCERNDAAFAAWAREVDYFKGTAVSVAVLPTIWWVHGGGRESELASPLKTLLERTLERSVAENSGQRHMDYGAQASIAEALLLGAQTYDAPAMREQALVLLGEMARRLDGNFWEFNVGEANSLIHGGQIRSLGHGHAIVANMLAHRQTGDAQYLTNARRFARYLLAVSYACHNGSKDPDFDWRGWCNGSNAGRDQIAEFPPWETQNGLLCITSLLPEAELEGGFYDILWYIARTGLAQFPAARTLKRLLDEAMQVHYLPRTEIASERDFYDSLPYLAYENPHDQTLLAPYQGSDCVLGELAYGGGLATTADDRLGVLVPRAAMLELRELHERLVHVWNPTGTPIETTVAARWTDGSTTTQPIIVPAREVVRIVLSR